MSGQKLYYYSYGSNMNEERITNRGVKYTERQVAKLTNYQFKLNQVRSNGHAAANVVLADAEVVYGALYTCSPDCLKKLDKFEGVATGRYKRENVKVELKDGTILDAVTYIGLVTDDDMRSVNRDYYEHIMCGKDIVPDHYVEFLETFKSWCVDETSK